LQTKTTTTTTETNIKKQQQQQQQHNKQTAKKNPNLIRQKIYLAPKCSSITYKIKQKLFPKASE
jgi:hypothetical protein